MKQFFLSAPKFAVIVLAGAMLPVCAQTQPDMHVCGSEPATFDQSHYAVGRPERHQKIESSESAFASDCCTYDVLQTALIYPSGTVFNSEIWKANSSKRFAMLFDARKYGHIFKHGSFIRAGMDDKRLGCNLNFVTRTYSAELAFMEASCLCFQG